ncbi:immunoglobulin-like domain-containing protein [Xylocopilactobacillus apis]|uniref:Pesticidal crystal protein Cry22Aa Ig-like domain-containing protein n=1 Tax=Xylocopilactobacillus apis TaxID=2932183 RepID=A0AAU9DFG5_9LACO|nr:immunoglobulin-like domain-containing protein [Xylocopilactobacillus apis]BDR55452.1 hypothetical protein KIMC2_00140 [Xylocopilactobacillus apis]
MKANHKFKFAGVASTALLLLSPISSAFTAAAQAVNVHADGNNWDYDVDNPNLSEYDQLLQNAGPSDGSVDWYPAQRFASSKNINASLLVKQLVDLSIATNDSTSDARKILFNDTTGDNANQSYKDTYDKYNLALGFISQILAFKNARVGKGAYLKQGFESPDGIQVGNFDPNEDKFADTGETPRDIIRQIPQSKDGVNISDVLGTAFFGNPDDAYAQLYINGYDNVSQNTENIIRETTSSITIVAQSKATGKKATAVFKLNNKTFNQLPDKVLLENRIDKSPAFSGTWGTKYIPESEKAEANSKGLSRLGDSTNGAFNQTTNLRNGLTDDQKFQLTGGGSTAWVDPKSGDGTIVVPRGTSADVIAKKIYQLQYQSNFSIRNVAPMKAIHGDEFSTHPSGSLSTKDNSYNVKFDEPAAGAGNLRDRTEQTNGNVTPVSNDQFLPAGTPDNNYLAVADPRQKEDGSQAGLKTDFSNKLLHTPLDTNSTGNDGIKQDYDNTVAKRIPNQADTSADGIDTPIGASHMDTKKFGHGLPGGVNFWPAYSVGNIDSSVNKGVGVHTDANKDQSDYFIDPSNSANDRPYGITTYPFGGPDAASTFGGGMTGSDTLAPGNAENQLGDVVHAFEPKDGKKDAASPFMVREAWDSTHGIFGTAPFTGTTEQQIKDKVAANGSFTDTTGKSIKKSFTYEAPLNNMVFKSYRNPYSTVISTALPFAQGNTEFTNDKYDDGSTFPTGGLDNPAGLAEPLVTHPGDMNNSTDGFNGKYSNKTDSTSLATLPYTNPWYVNYHGTAATNTKDDVDYNYQITDKTAHQININPDPSTGNGNNTANSLHISDATWEKHRFESSPSTGSSINVTTPTEKPGIYNTNSKVKQHGSPTHNFPVDADVGKNNVFQDWIIQPISINDPLKGNDYSSSLDGKYPGSSADAADLKINHDYKLSSTELEQVDDANNNDDFKDITVPHTSNGLNFLHPETGGGVGWGNHITDSVGGKTTGWVIPASGLTNDMSYTELFIPNVSGSSPSYVSSSDSRGYLVGAPINKRYVVWKYPQSRTERHLQLAKNQGYVLINASGISESLSKKLSKYQIPASATSGLNNLDGIYNISGTAPNITHFTNGELPYISPLNDDPKYRGGLLGVMSIHGDGAGKGVTVTNYTTTDTDDASSSPQLVTQDSNFGGSIYNNLLSSARFGAPVFLKTPGFTDDSHTVRADTAALGQFASDTDLHYGLAWNDSSDLPQVKIKRSLNVQYLVPVSVVRTVETTWSQVATARYVHISGLDYDGRWDRTQNVKTTYDNYHLYLGDVRLENSSSATGDLKDRIDTNTDSTDQKKYDCIDSSTSLVTLDKLRPVNNQIAYTRIDQSYPHYDSELFDKGSNTDDISANKSGGDNRKTWLGNSNELSDDSNKNKKADASEKIGTSDDYSIGIVKAPKKFFKTVDNDKKKDFIVVNGKLQSEDGVNQSTENAADGKEGINKTMDVDANDNGMAISDPDSYTTLAKAYNVNISGNDAKAKVTPNDKDNSANKWDRVKLVEQLMQNGGDASAFYYIPSLPRLYSNWGKARVNVVVYDQAAVPAPTKQDTKPSFSTTDVSGGNDPFNVSLRPYTTTYDDGAVLTSANVPQNFKNLLSRTLVAGNPDLVDSTGKVAANKLQQILVSSFLGSWQQNDGSFKQTDSGRGVSSPLYMYGGFGISNSDTKNSYSQWPKGYVDGTGDYSNAVNSFPGDFYRGGADLRLTDGSGKINGIPVTALSADISKVDVTKPGTYPVVYTYTNPSNAKDTASITVPVTVTDSSAPVFAFQGSTDSTINVGDSFNENEYKVVGSWTIFNNYGGDYSKLPNFEGIAKSSDGTPQVTITGHVDTHTPGIYQLTYKATSISGATTTMVRNITVLAKENAAEWTLTPNKMVGYINYVPGYGIMVYNAPAGKATGQRLAHGTAWKISQRAVNTKGDVYYAVGKNQWINGKYVSFTPINTITPLRGEVQIVYKKGYGVNLWKSAGTTNGFYPGRKLQHGSKWKTSGKQNGFYKVGKDQWIQGDYASYKAY